MQRQARKMIYGMVKLRHLSGSNLLRLDLRIHGESPHSTQHFDRSTHWLSSHPLFAGWRLITGQFSHGTVSVKGFSLSAP